MTAARAIRTPTADTARAPTPTHTRPAPARTPAKKPWAMTGPPLLGASVLQRSPADAATPATSLPVSSPDDAAEREATAVAKRVVQQPGPAITTAAPPSTLHRASVERSLPASPVRGAAPDQSSGSPLPTSLRAFMEERFGADFSVVRVHTDDRAAALSRQLHARAFTVGNHVYFAKGAYQPDSADGRELLAHELTHTIQQGAAPRTAPRDGGAAVNVATSPRVHRSWLPDPRKYIADKAAATIPAFTLFTVVIGYNPITNARVERNAGNILRGAIDLIPGGHLISEALANYGIFDAVSAWTQQQFDTIKHIGSTIWGELEAFIEQQDWTALGDLEGAYNRGKYIITSKVDKLEAFAKGLKDGIVKLIKDAVLKPLAAHARTTPGYPVLCSVMGKDPITDEPAAQDAEALLGAFMTLIGEQGLWSTMKEANAVPRAFAWFKTTVAELKAFVAEIPGLFVAAFKSLELVDIVLVPRAFLKLARVFGGFAARFIGWGANAVWNLLEIVFDVVKPGIMGYVKRTGAALKRILRDPLPFVRNLVSAGQQGFQRFADRFGTHLKAGLLEWLTGSLPGVYIPQSFELKELVKFVFSVLGLTWANVRAKLVKAVGETAVATMEKGFDIVVTLVKEGPAAAWEQIRESIGNLKDRVVGGIVNLVVGLIAQKAVPKVVALFVPGAGFISAIITIYETVMVFVQKLARMAAVVRAFVDSIVQIAAGNVAAAAKHVEGVLAGLLSLAINFLAGFAGLGKVADKVQALLEKLRAPIDKALDRVVAWIVSMAKKLFAGAQSVVQKLFNWGATKSKFKDRDGRTHTVYVQEGAKPSLKIASTPMAVESFLAIFLGTKTDGFKKDNAAKIAAVQAAIAGAKKVVDQIAAAERAGKDEVALRSFQQHLLGENIKICEALSALINREAGLGKLREKYLLEGITGTYGAMPKPVGDGFTADHQPQAAILQAAAEFDCFSSTGELSKRASARARHGFAINLHHIRHTAGSTYGSKGKATKEGFLNRIKALVLGKEPTEQRKLIVAEIKADLLRDVKAMLGVVAPGSPHWDDILKSGEGTEKERKELVGDVSKRIIAGETQMAAQDIESLIG